MALDWGDTRLLEAEPGEYISTARLEKGGQRWFIGAITNAARRTAILNLSFLPKGLYIATLYIDAPGTDWKTNPKAYRISTRAVTAGTTLRVPLAPGGGCAISLVPVR